MKIFTLLVSVALVSISCQKEGKPSDKISAKASDSLAAAIASDYEANLRNMTAPAQNMPNPIVTNTANTTTAATVQPTKPGMNPPHGQPGHRCDIAVGAPLSSKPTTPTPTNTTAASTDNKYSVSFPNGQNPNQSVNVSQTTTPGATITPLEMPKKVETTLPGMEGKPNPKHGEEGHRCDIPVGVTLP